MEWNGVKGVKGSKVARKIESPYEMEILGVL